MDAARVIPTSKIITMHEYTYNPSFMLHFIVMKDKLLYGK
jgi:hypothetical protein